MRDPLQSIATCFEQVAFFFPSGDPKTQVSYERRASYLDNRNFSRESLANMLKEYHTHLGASSETQKMIEELRHKDTLTVMTGQQAGILTGPLYTLYKAMTTIRLAKEQREKLGRPVVPIFWIAGEDHDWLEIRETFFLNSEGRPLPCRLKGDGGGKSVGHQQVPSWETIRTQLMGIPDGKFKALVLKQCQKFMEQAENLTQWFALTLQWLLQKWGLIFFDPLLPGFKRLAAPQYEQILKLHADVRVALAERTKEWVNLGFEPQIKPTTGGEANLFLSVPERRAIMSNDHGFYLRGRNKPWDLDTLNSLLTQKPEQFSPNVVTRPIVQEALFPTLAYVAGPGELNYWAQLGEVFVTFGFEMPILYPRLSAVVLTSSWQKYLSKESLTINDIYGGLEKQRERCVRESDTLEIDKRFRKLRLHIEKGYAELEPLKEIHVNVQDWLPRNEAKIKFQLDYLQSKIWQAQRKQCSNVLKRLQELEDGINPNHSRQERIINPLSFIAGYGLSFVDRVAELPINSFSEHQILL